MGKVCINCGEITKSAVELCVHCGGEPNAPLEVDETSVVDLPAGTKLQTLTVLSYGLALFNIIIGTACSFVFMFVPNLLQVDSVKLLIVFVLLQPLVALICLVLQIDAVVRYKSAKHAPVNLRLANLSYRLSVLAILVWDIFVLTWFILEVCNFKLR